MMFIWTIVDDICDLFHINNSFHYHIILNEVPEIHREL